MNKEIETLEETEKEAIFRIETSWERRGRIQGRIEGETEASVRFVRFAKRLLKRGMSIDEIVTLTELSREEVEKLRYSE